MKCFDRVPLKYSFEHLTSKTETCDQIVLMKLFLMMLYGCIVVDYKNSKKKLDQQYYPLNTFKTTNLPFNS
jgi:hypothetical protein